MGEAENKFIPFAKPYISKETIEVMVDRTRALLKGAADDGNRLSNGENCRKLEETVAEISGAKYAVAVSSCSMGLAIGLGAARAFGICFSQSFTWDSTAIAASMCGSPVRFFDIDPDRWCVKDYPYGADPKEGGYVLAVDTFGFEFTPTTRAPVWFDRAHSLGVRFKRMGNASVVSLSPSKIITAGEGGIILTNQENFMAAYAKARDYIARLEEFNAMLALENMKYLSMLMEWKRSTYYYYKEHLPLKFQEGNGNFSVIGGLFRDQATRDFVVEYATKKGMETKTYYTPLHSQNPSEAGKLPVTENVYSRIICLPSWYGVDRSLVVDIIKEGLHEYDHRT